MRRSQTRLAHQILVCQDLRSCPQLACRLDEYCSFQRTYSSSSGCKADGRNCESCLHVMLWTSAPQATGVLNRSPSRPTPKIARGGRQEWHVDPDLRSRQDLDLIGSDFQRHLDRRRPVNSISLHQTQCKPRTVNQNQSLGRLLMRASRDVESDATAK